MEFGEWLRHKREEKSVDLRSLARSAKLDPSTISRVERGIIDPALSTVVRITHALELKSEDFYSSFSGTASDIMDHLKGAETQVVTLEDVIGFEKLVIKNPQALESLMADKINRIQIAFTETDQFSGISPFSFSSREIFKIFDGSPLYQVVIQYPYLLEFSIKPSSILSILRKGGLIIRWDVCAYINGKWSEKGLQAKVGSEEAKLQTITNTSLCNKSGSKVRLSDVVRADDILADNGEIIIMSWRALEYEREGKLRHEPSKEHRAFPSDWWNLQRMKYGYLLILVSRWLEAFGLSDSSWLDEIRKEINS